MSPGWFGVGIGFGAIGSALTGAHPLMTAVLLLPAFGFSAMELTRDD